jgi:hypothetical protein
MARGGAMQTEMHTAEPFVPEPSASEVEAAIGKLKRYTSPGIDQIAAKLIQVAGETLRSEIHKIMKLIWNKEKLPRQWKGSTVVFVHRNGDKIDRSNYRVISFLSTLYNTLSNIFLSRVNPYANQIICYNQCGFRCNR